VSRHSTEDIEAPEETEPVEVESAPERYRAEIRPRPPRFRWWRRWPAGLVRDVQLVTTHVIRPVLRRVDGIVKECGDVVLVESELERAPVVLGERWAGWKARRMVRAAYRRDARQGQPWA
jgi:hypothetical protein